VVRRLACLPVEPPYSVLVSGHRIARLPAPRRPRRLRTLLVTITPTSKVLEMDSNRSNSDPRTACAAEDLGDPPPDPDSSPSTVQQCDYSDYSAAHGGHGPVRSNTPAARHSRVGPPAEINGGRRRNRRCRHRQQGSQGNSASLEPGRPPHANDNGHRRTCISAARIRAFVDEFNWHRQQRFVSRPIAQDPPYTSMFGLAGSSFTTRPGPLSGEIWVNAEVNPGFGVSDGRERDAMDLRLAEQENKNWSLEGDNAG
jgi:hypothetical protein